MAHRQLASIRSQFPFFFPREDGSVPVYFDHAATAQKPQCVLDEMMRLYASENANIHRSAHCFGQKMTERYEQARETAADFIGAASPEEIVFTSGTTGSINLLAQMLEDRIGPGDQIAVSQLEHHSNFVPWQQLAKRRGAGFIVIPPDASGRLSPETCRRYLSKRTKVFAFAHVYNATGAVNPAGELVHLAQECGAMTVVDAAQSCAHLPIDVQELGCDFLAFSGHKVYGPNGIGVLYGKRAWLDILPPVRFGGEMVDTVTERETTFAPAPLRLEAGTPNYIGAAVMARALRFLMDIGREAVWEHDLELTSYCKQRLMELPRVHVWGESLPLCGIVSFAISGIHPFDAGTFYDHAGIAVRTGSHCCQPGMAALGVDSTIRISFGLYNTRKEVDFFIKKTKQLMEMIPE